MSEWSDKEVARIKQLVAERRVLAEKSVQDTNKIVAGSADFWEATKRATKELIDKINSGVGEDLLLWDNEKPNIVKIRATGVLAGPHLTATYGSTTHKLASSTLLANKEFQMTVSETGKLLWAGRGNKTYTAEEVAEEITGDLTSSLGKR